MVKKLIRMLKERRSEAKSGLLSLKPVTILDRYKNCAMRAEHHPPITSAPATVTFKPVSTKEKRQTLRISWSKSDILACCSCCLALIVLQQAA